MLEISVVLYSSQRLVSSSVGAYYSTSSSCLEMYLFAKDPHLTNFLHYIIIRNWFTEFKSVK